MLTVYLLGGTLFGDCLLVAMVSSHWLCWSPWLQLNTRIPKILVMVATWAISPFDEITEEVTFKKWRSFSQFWFDKWTSSDIVAW